MAAVVVVAIPISRASGNGGLTSCPKRDGRVGKGLVAVGPPLLVATLSGKEIETGRAAVGLSLLEVVGSGKESGKGRAVGPSLLVAAGGGEKGAADARRARHLRRGHRGGLEHHVLFRAHEWGGQSKELALVKRINKRSREGVTTRAKN